jgi:orotidine-5'-phosphate decarboxylase
MKLAIALDLRTPDANIELAKRIAGEVGDPEKIALKIGLKTFIAAGPAIFDAMKDFPFEKVLDLKLHDIPNTMADAALQIAALGVSMFTVHASAGAAALHHVHKTLVHPNIPNPPKMLAVTVLTSLDDGGCSNIYESSAHTTAHRLVKQAVDGCADGIVCSPRELLHINHWAANYTSSRGPTPKLIKFVPGIELAPRKDDQQRKGSLKDAFRGGADYIVIGRPIYEATNPVEVVKRIIGKIELMESFDNQFEEVANWTS